MAPGWPSWPPDNRIGRSTAYRHLHQGIDVLAAQAPDLHQALERGRAAGLLLLAVASSASARAELVRTSR